MLDARGEVVVGRGATTRRGKSVDPCGVSSAGRVCAKITKDANQAFEPAVEGEDLADAGGRGGKIDEVCERVVQREGRGSVESCSDHADSSGEVGG